MQKNILYENTKICFKLKTETLFWYKDILRGFNQIAQKKFTAHLNSKLHKLFIKVW